MNPYIKEVISSPLTDSYIYDSTLKVLNSVSTEHNHIYILQMKGWIDNLSDGTKGKELKERSESIISDMVKVDANEDTEYFREDFIINTLINNGFINNYKDMVTDMSSEKVGVVYSIITNSHDNINTNTDVSIVESMDVVQDILLSSRAIVDNVYKNREEIDSDLQYKILAIVKRAFPLFVKTVLRAEEMKRKNEEKENVQNT